MDKSYNEYYKVWNYWVHFLEGLGYPHDTIVSVASYKAATCMR